jgi:hypothetical protein
MDTNAGSITEQEAPKAFQILNDDDAATGDRKPTARSGCSSGDCSQLFSCCNATCNCAVWG